MLQHVSAALRKHSGCCVACGVWQPTTAQHVHDHVQAVNQRRLLQRQDPLERGVLSSQGILLCHPLGACQPQRLLVRQAPVTEPRGQHRGHGRPHGGVGVQGPRPRRPHQLPQGRQVVDRDLLQKPRHVEQPQPR